MPNIARLKFISACTFATLLSSPVWAACPSPYGGASCTISGTDVCEEVSNTLTCDLTLSGAYDEHGGKGFVVLDGNTYKAFGYVSKLDGLGIPSIKFCCEFPDSDFTSGNTHYVVLKGSDHADEPLSFWYKDDGVPFTVYNLAPSTEDPLEAEIFGYDENDIIIGSDSTDTDYSEVLRGRDGHDTICAQDGNDTLYGGIGDDDMDGEGGADDSYGGAGHDRIRDEEGSTNNLWGDDGEDTFCVEDIAGSASTALGGSGADVLWGDSNDDGSGGAHADTCNSGTASFTNCTAITVEPTDCQVDFTSECSSCNLHDFDD